MTHRVFYSGFNYTSFQIINFKVQVDYGNDGVVQFSEQLHRADQSFNELLICFCWSLNISLSFDTNTRDFYPELNCAAHDWSVCVSEHQGENPE